MKEWWWMIVDRIWLVPLATLLGPLRTTWLIALTGIRVTPITLSPIGRQSASGGGSLHASTSHISTGLQSQ